jgi:hypothetical protein
MLAAVLIISFIIVGITASYYCDKIFGDAGIVIAMVGILLPLAFIVGTILNHLTGFGA